MSARDQQADRAGPASNYGWDDAIRQYFQALERFPLLSAEEEISLARRMEAAKARMAYAAFQFPEALEMLLQWIAEPRRRRRKTRRCGAEKGRRTSRGREQDIRRLTAYCEQMARDAAIVDGTGAGTARAIEAAQRLRRIRRRAARAAVDLDVDMRFFSRVATVLLDQTGDEDQHRVIRRRVARPGDAAQASGLPSLPGADALLATIQRSARQYEAAKRRFCEHNLRLVVSVAKRYRRSGLPFLDLIQEGNMGLMLAAERFDHRRGCRFSTYAVWWIRRYISDAVASQSRIISVSERIMGRLAEVETATRRLLHETGREPSAEEIAEVTGISVRDVSQVLLLLRSRSTVDADSVEGLLASCEEDMSSELAGPSDEERMMLHDRLAVALETLSYCEREIIKLRYGVGDRSTYSLDEVGHVFELSGERIRQIEKRALQLLRRHEACEALTDFFGG